MCLMCGEPTHLTGQCQMYKDINYMICYPILENVKFVDDHIREITDGFSRVKIHEFMIDLIYFVKKR